MELSFLIESSRITVPFDRYSISGKPKRNVETGKYGMEDIIFNPDLPFMKPQQRFIFEKLASEYIIVYNNSKHRDDIYEKLVQDHLKILSEKNDLEKEVKRYADQMKELLEKNQVLEQKIEILETEREMSNKRIQALETENETSNKYRYFGKLIEGFRRKILNENNITFTNKTDGFEWSHFKRNDEKLSQTLEKLNISLDEWKIIETFYKSKRNVFIHQRISKETLVKTLTILDSENQELFKKLIDIDDDRFLTN